MARQAHPRVATLSPSFPTTAHRARKRPTDHRMTPHAPLRRDARGRSRTAGRAGATDLAGSRWGWSGM